MKLKLLAAAAALLCGAHAFAGINTDDNNAELFAVAWDEAKATYVLDTGLTLGSLLGQGSNKIWSFDVSASANFAGFKTADGNTNDFTQFTGTRWALFAVDDTNNFNFDGQDLRYLSTTTGGTKPTLKSDVLEPTLLSMADFTLTQNQNGLTPDLTKNGDSLNLLGSPAHFIEQSYGGQYGAFAGNAFGSGATALFLCAPNPLDQFSEAPCSSKNSLGLDMQAAFDGTKFDVSVAAAIPEPGTYALLLVGLATVGVAARRRRA